MVANKTKNQIYSDLVFSEVSKYVGKPGSDDAILKKYKSLCKKSGTLIRNVGLIQYLTYLQAKGTKPSETHHHDLLIHLQQELNRLKLLESSDVNKFLEIIRKQELPEYMHLTIQTLRLTQWHKRIADILIEV